jgi:hemolysin activation/secretion protein
MRSARFAASLSLALFSAWASHAFAQAPDSRKADPGRIGERFSPQTPTEAPALPEIPVAPLPASTSPANPGTFVLSAVDIEGASVYEAADFVPLYQPEIGRSLTLEDVQKLIEAITAKYRADGYFLSRAEAPPQDLALGILHVKIVEGFIGNVSFEGIAEDKQANLRTIAAHITEQRPAKLANLERYLLLMQDTPGTSITPHLQVSDAATGAFGLMIRVEAKAFNAELHLDNRGTSLVGPLEQTATLALNNILLDNSRTRIMVATTPAEPRQLQYVEASHDVALRTEGTRLLLDASFGQVRSAGTPSESNIKTKTYNLEAALSHPFIRFNAQTLTGRVAFDSESARQVQPFFATYDDELRVLRFALIDQFTDGLNGLNLLSAQVSQGLDILGASGANRSNISRFGGRDDFTKINLSAIRRQTLAPGWALQLAGVAQRSRTPLLLAEQFGIGGATFGRAFDPSQITGDDGEAGYIELQGTRDTIYEMVPWIQYFAFLDGGETSFQSTGASNSQRLASTGLGVRLKLYRTFSGEFLVAFPVAQHVSDGTPHKGNSFYFNINADF